MKRRTLADVWERYCAEGSVVAFPVEVRQSA